MQGSNHSIGDRMELDKQVSAIASILGKSKTQKNHEGRRKPKMVNRHTWSMDEEMLAIKLYKAKANREEVLKALEATEITYSSMQLKMNNIRYLDTGKGLKNVSSMTAGLWDKMK